MEPLLHKQLEIRDVLSCLSRQTDALRAGQLLQNGRLEYFRAALKCDRFLVVASMVRNLLHYDLFKTEQDLARMEAKIQRNDRSELVEQCCLIIEFFVLVHPAVRVWTLHPAHERWWLLDNSLDLRKIVFRLARLSFVTPMSGLRRSINIAVIDAVVARSETTTVSWQEILLIFKEARAAHLSALFTPFLRILEEQSDRIPKEAATLFLSYVTDIIYHRANFHGLYTKGREGRIILKLLKLGASPMISRDGHFGLYQKVKRYYDDGEEPWWMSYEFPKALASRPTALRKMYAREWGAEFLTELRRHLCCNLDLSAGLYRRNMFKVFKLQCIAARNLRREDLDALPPVLRFIAAKHRPRRLIWADLVAL